MKKAALFLVVALLFGYSFSVQAQQRGKVPRIGFLSATTPSTISARTEAFRNGLRELGYVEGKNIVIEFRYAEGKVERLPALAAELVGLKVDAIVTAGPTVTRPARQATSTIPIVMTFDDDPVGSGFAASLARPKGNITGLSTLNPEIAGKQMELLKHVVPKLARVAVLGPSTRPGTAQALKEIELVAESFAAKHQFLDVQDPNDIDAAFRAVSNGRAEGILVLQGPVINASRVKIVELAQATKFEFIINLKAAKQIGLTIPDRVLERANKVIK